MATPWMIPAIKSTEDMVHATGLAAGSSMLARHARWLTVFQHQGLRDLIVNRPRMDLQGFSSDVYRCYQGVTRWTQLGPLDVHRQIRQGLPGIALYVSASMGFDSMSDALGYFSLTNKTALNKRDAVLTSEQSEHALRLATVAGIAAEYFGTPELGKRYLHTPNFALGGETPIELLRTAAGEDLVLQELQTQIDGGPV